MKNRKDKHFKISSNFRIQNVSRELRKLIGNLARRFWKHLRKVRQNSIKNLICSLFLRAKANDSHKRDIVRMKLRKSVFRKLGLNSGRFVCAEMTSGSFRAEGVSARIGKQPSCQRETCLCGDLPRSTYLKLLIYLLIHLLGY